MNQFIPNFSENSPRSQTEKITEFLNNEFNQKRFLPSRIYSMADSTGSNAVKFSKIIESMQKILNNLNEDFWKEVPSVYQINLNDTLSKDDFEMLFKS